MDAQLPESQYVVRKTFVEIDDDLDEPKAELRRSKSDGSLTSSSASTPKSPEELQQWYSNLEKGRLTPEATESGVGRGRDLDHMLWASSSSNSTNHTGDKSPDVLSAKKSLSRAEQDLVLEAVPDDYKCKCRRPYLGPCKFFVTKPKGCVNGLTCKFCHHPKHRINANHDRPAQKKRAKVKDVLENLPDDPELAAAIASNLTQKPYMKNKLKNMRPEVHALLSKFVDGDAPSDVPQASDAAASTTKISL